MASRINGVRQNDPILSIAAQMQDKQRQIVDWMRDVMERREIAPRAWAERAKLGKDTVSRAIKPDYQFVTSTTTIAKLAEALNETPPGPAAGIPRVEVLHSIVEIMLDGLLPGQKLDPTTSHALASALRDTLLHLADESGDGEDPKVVRALARAALKQRTRLPV